MVTGDSLIEKLDNDTFRVFNMRNYVISRDAGGNVIDLVIKETLDYESVPDDIKSFIDDSKKDEPIDLYTRVYKSEGKYKLYQEINEIVVAGSEDELDELSDMYISVRWNKIDGENYGRGFVEDHLGTFISLEKQMQVLNQSAVVASKTVFTVSPNGMTKYKDFIEAKNGEAIIGNESDIGTVKSGKTYDLQQTYNLVNDYKRELAEAFLMSSASIRDAERVTAHEVQLIASELEASFGGIYTAISEDIQVPLVKNAMSSLNIDGGDDVDVIITAGVEALGRNVELSKVNSLINELMLLSNLVGTEEVAKKINVSSFITSMVANSGVASKDFIISDIRASVKDNVKKENDMVQGAVNEGLTQAGRTIGSQA
jgi:hypothetical protein